MGGLINLLSDLGQPSGTTNSRQGVQGTGFQAVFGAAMQTGGKASDQPAPTPPVSPPRETLLDGLGKMRERALAEVTPNQTEGQKGVSDGLAPLVSSLAEAIAEFDQDTGLGLAASLRSGLAPEGETADPATIPGPLDGGAPETLNESLQALVAVIGFVERTARALPFSPVGVSGIQTADALTAGVNNGTAKAQGDANAAIATDTAGALTLRTTLTATPAMPATTGKVAGVLAANPPMTGGGNGGTQAAGTNPPMITGTGALPPGEFPATSPLVAATGEVPATATNPGTPAPAVPLADGIKGGVTIAQAASIPATIAGKAVGVLAANPSMTAEGSGSTQTTGTTPFVTTGAGTLASDEIPARSPAVVPTPGTPAPAVPLADGIKGGVTTAQTAPIPATTGKAAGVLAGNPPIAAEGRGSTQTTGTTPFVTTGAGALTSGENPAKSPVVVPTTAAAQNVVPVAYAATLSQEAVSTGTVPIPDQPQPGLLRRAESAASPLVGEPGPLGKPTGATPARSLAAQQVGLGTALPQTGDAPAPAAPRPAEPGAIGSPTSPAVVSDPRLVPLSVGMPGTTDPAPALLGLVVAQAFTALESMRERGAGLARERMPELTPLSGSEIFLRAPPGPDRPGPGLERTAANGSPAGSRFAAALTAQIRATEGRTLIELSPRGLGQVEVDIRTEADGSMKVTIRADNPVVLNTLRDAREMLAQSIGGTDGAVLDFQEGSPGQDQGRQGAALSQGVTGDDEGSATTAEPTTESEVIGGGQLDFMT